MMEADGGRVGFSGCLVGLIRGCTRVDWVHLSTPWRCLHFDLEKSVSHFQRI